MKESGKRDVASLCGNMGPRLILICVSPVLPLYCVFFFVGREREGEREARDAFLFWFCSTWPACLPVPQAHIHVEGALKLCLKKGTVLGFRPFFFSFPCSFVSKLFVFVLVLVLVSLFHAFYPVLVLFSVNKKTSSRPLVFRP